ncbi:MULTISPECIES: integrase family protein [unclassified Acinetobacter]|uniref:tyrosine-type recombinase/integrase n=1 Tax=unclassified Acinetobacter TaxID=196816 RepID=UPI0018ABFA23|nr:MULTISPECIES: integrase family protein [unclassified Acinetobacter]MBJ9952449.1 integrase family protein [Acinetobacter baumannii]
MKIKFTTTKVFKLESPEDGKNQKFYWDTDAQGLSVRVTKNENRSYIFQSRSLGQSIRITIGSVDTWSLDDARKEARRLQHLCDQGIDPRRTKAEEVLKNEEFFKRTELEAILFGVVFMEYIEANKAEWSISHLESHFTYIHRGGEAKKRGKGVTQPGAMAALLDVPLSEITADKLTQWQQKESETRKGSAALCFRLVRAFINWCAEHEVYSKIISKDVHEAKKVRKSVPVLKPRKRALQRDQLADWFLAVREVPNIMHRVFLQITILTGPRSESMRSVKHEHLDFKWKTIKIWDKYEQDYRLIPMTPYVEKLLRTLPVNSKSDYIFWTDQSDCGYITDVRRKYHEKLDERQLPRITIHDLRRSFSNLTEWLEIPAGVVAQLMGHKPSATQEKHYKDRPVDLLRIYLTKIEEWILQQAKVVQ